MPVQTEIITVIGVSATFDAASEAEKRTGFLRHYSGDIARGRMCPGSAVAQSAVRRLRQSRYDSEFVAERLPYGI